MRPRWSSMDTGRTLAGRASTPAETDAYPVGVAINTPSVLRVAAPLVRAAAGAARSSTVRAAAGSVARRLDAGAARTPFVPAAMRVERWRAVRAGERVDQTAVTLWFGEGPALPRPGGNDSLRGGWRASARGSWARRRWRR